MDWTITDWGHAESIRCGDDDDDDDDGDGDFDGDDGDDDVDDAHHHL